MEHLLGPRGGLRMVYSNLVDWIADRRDGSNRRSGLGGTRCGGKPSPRWRGCPRIPRQNAPPSPPRAPHPGASGLSLLPPPRGAPVLLLLGSTVRAGLLRPSPLPT